MYRLIDSQIHGITIIRISDNTSISPDETNPLYNQFLKWCDEGNTPEEWTPEEIS